MLTVVAASMTIVMVMGDFDLSVGSMASLAGVVAALLFTLGLSGVGRSRNCAAESVSPAAPQRRARQPHRHPAVHRDTCDADGLLRRSRS